MKNRKRSGFVAVIVLVVLVILLVGVGIWYWMNARGGSATTSTSQTGTVPSATTQQFPVNGTGQNATSGMVTITALDTSPTPVTTNPSAQDRNDLRKQDLEKISQAIDAYFDANNFLYPASLGELVPKYMDTIPTDPLTHEPYQYATDDNLQKYQVCAILENVAVNPTCFISGAGWP